MCVLNDRKGGMITLLSLIFMLLATVWIGAMFSVSSLKKKYSEGLGKAEQATFLAEKGIALGYVELKYHGFKWFTHTKDANGILKENPKIKSTPSLSQLYVKGAEWDGNGDYLPTGDSHLRVRTYQDDTLNTWIVARAEMDGVVRVARMRLESGQLYDYFMFVPGNLVLKGSNYFDGRGVGKIYVDGDIVCAGKNIVFKDVPELSTGTSGHFRVSTWSKVPPFAFDSSSDFAGSSDLDGYALLFTEDNEFGYDTHCYPADLASEMKWSDYGPKYIFSRYEDESHWHFYDTPKFIFTKEKMGDKVEGWDNYNPDETEVVAKVPFALYDDTGEPIKRDFDIYWGDDADKKGELPVKFVRFYYKDEEGKWRITSDPSKHEGVVAQVFDGKDTAKETPYIDYKIHGKLCHIQVREDGIEYEYNGNTYHFDVDYERNWWKVKDDPNPDKYLNDPRQYVQSGYSRKDGDPSWVDPSNDENKYPEHTWINVLNTSDASHLERFRDWIEGNYNYDGENENEAHKLNLSNVIKVGGLDAKTQDPPEINISFETKAKEEGIWVGYEAIEIPEQLIELINNDDDIEGIEDLPAFLRKRIKSAFTVYVNGEKVYAENSAAPPPDWLKSEEFYTGNDKFHKTGIKAKVLTIDVKKMAEELGEELGKTNGVIWINYRKPEEDLSHNYNKAVRLVNGEVLPRDLTIVTPQSVMIQGDFNCKDNDGNPDDSEWKPASIITDGDVYVLSEHFTPPTEAPAYKVPRFPGDSDYPYFKNAWNYIKRSSEKWWSYLLNRLGEDFWPDEKDPDKTEKLNHIKEAIAEFYDSLDDKKYAAPDMEKFDIEDIDPGNYRTISKAIISAFYKTHNPKASLPGYAKAMPVVGDSKDDRHIYIYASLVRSPSGNKPIGTRVYYLENWSWMNGYDDSWDDLPSNAEVVLKGMFPRVRSPEEEMAESDRWSDDYSTFIFVSGGNWDGGKQGEAIKINPGPVPKYYAQDYNNNYPPGSALVAAVKAYYISSNPSDFDRHPEGT